VILNLFVINLRYIHILHVQYIDNKTANNL